jgi:hypothetical protein
MELADLLDGLGYRESPNFLSPGTEGFDSAIDYAHVFRQAAKPPCSLQGVYTLSADKRSFTPIVYVCQVDNEDAGREVHRLVWNQDVVPFLIVNSAQRVRLYPGFRYCPTAGASDDACLGALADYGTVTQIAELRRHLDAKAIDGGGIWTKWGKAVTPANRVDWHLLNNLKRLDNWLQETGGRDRDVSHALIGKYVYLHYLKDREILSAKKLEGWGISREAIFGGDATVDGLREVSEHLDDWLNGTVFPIDFDSPKAPKDEHVRRVAGTFAGNQPADDGSWQLHLGFKAYDFSYIPIETLSVVYEQFLHAPGKVGAPSHGRSVGAYYTPMPVVNFMLAELEERHPLQRGMRVFDPACGSGAFLVQCYRRLIEKEFSPGSNGPLSPARLRNLLEEHIFGVDRDPDACSVAELSLILTLLDYVTPPDLEPKGHGRARPLPKLRDKNIFCDNFFHSHTKWQERIGTRKCDWIVGNPPWKELNPKKLLDGEEPVWQWMVANQTKRPVGGNQMARAFAWRASEYLAEGGEVAMFLPAMTLFDDSAEAFRRHFLRSMDLGSVANFANLAEVISARRFRVPAAALFWTVRREDPGESGSEESIRVYSPLLANQEPIYRRDKRERTEAWSIVTNASEVRDIPAQDVMTGTGLPWKLATWGSALDERLLRMLKRRFPSIADAEEAGMIILSEGLQLRHKAGTKGEEEAEGDSGNANGEDGHEAPRDEAVDPIPEVIGKNQLDVKKLNRLRHFFAFPQESLEPLGEDLAFARKGRSKLPLSVCRPPHVIVSAARNYAIYSDEFIVVPPRQIGIASPYGDEKLLKAASLFLSSDFVYYHQFLTSTEFGVKRDRATLKALRELPFPLRELTLSDLREWTSLHTRLVRASCEQFHRGSGMPGPLFQRANENGQMTEFLEQLNSLVYDTLGLDRRDRSLVEDLVHVRLELNDGKVGEGAISRPTAQELRGYARALKSELDGFVEGVLAKWYKVDIVHEKLSAMVQIALIASRSKAGDSIVISSDAPTAVELENTRGQLRKTRSQWVYFDRNLRIYDGDTTFVLKPMQRFHWTTTQARIDAREIIAETIGGGD